MKKGVLGITYSFYAVLAFIFAMLGNFTIGALLLGFVMLVEKDEWTVRQCMQAFFLNIFYAIGSGIDNVFSLGGFLGVFNPLAWIGTIVTAVFGILTLIFGLIGLVRVAKGQEANVPVLVKLVDKAFGIVRQVAPQYAPPQAAYPYPPQAAYPQQPVYPQQGMPQQMPPQQAPQYPQDMPQQPPQAPPAQ